MLGSRVKGFLNLTKADSSQWTWKAWDLYLKSRPNILIWEDTEVIQKNHAIWVKNNCPALLGSNKKEMERKKAK